MGDAAVRLLVVGMVQGVCFRATAKHQAKALGLTGWVKNLPDGRVEAYAEGDKNNLDALVSWCHDGPAGARVVRVDAEWIEPEGVPGPFKIAF